MNDTHQDQQNDPLPEYDWDPHRREAQKRWHQLYRMELLRDAANSLPPWTGLWISEVSCACPTQGFGAFEAHPFYFRARHGFWDLWVVGHGENPVADDENRHLLHLEGLDSTHGCLEMAEVLPILCNGYLQFIAKHRERIAGVKEQMMKFLLNEDAQKEDTR